MKNLFEKVDSFHLSDIKNPTHPSIFIEEEAYDILTQLSHIKPSSFLV